MKALAAATDFRLVCPLPPGQESAVEALRSAGIDVRPAAVPARSKWAEAKRLLGAAARGEPYVMYRRHAWREAAAIWDAERTAWMRDSAFGSTAIGTPFLSLSLAAP